VSRNRIVERKGGKIEAPTSGWGGGEGMRRWRSEQTEKIGKNRATELISGGGDGEHRLGCSRRGEGTYLQGITLQRGFLEVKRLVLGGEDS